MKRETILIPAGVFSMGDAIIKKRKEIAEKLKNGEDVIIDNKTGELQDCDDTDISSDRKIEVPAGKLAGKDEHEIPNNKRIEVPYGKFCYPSFYWYEKDKELFKAEKGAMKKYFPNFKLDKLEDGRLCWIGDLNPGGKSGGKWTLMAVYENNHPNNDTYGGSIKVYSIKPDLKELYEEARGLPHVLRDQDGNLYMCTSRSEDFIVDHKNSYSAASSLAWAAKWIYLIELWLFDEIGDEIFGHYY